MRRASSLAAALVALVAVLPAPAAARVLLSVDEALALAFPGATVERGTLYPTPEQLATASRLAGRRIDATIVHPYVARQAGALVGTAYFDVHVVRTLAETVMVTVDPQGKLGRIEVLSFDEPPEYLPRELWYRQFDGRALDDELELQRAIRPVAGASLTARATTDAARRVLALHRALQPPAAPPEGTKP